MWRVFGEPVNFRFTQSMTLAGKTLFLDRFGLLNIAKTTGPKAIIHKSRVRVDVEDAWIHGVNQ